MEEYVSLDPMNICFLGSVAVMPRVNRLRDSVEQSRFLSFYKRLDASFEIQSAVDYSKRTIGRLVRVEVIHNILLVVRLSSHSFSPRIYERWALTPSSRKSSLVSSDFCERSRHWRNDGKNLALRRRSQKSSIGFRSHCIELSRSRLQISFIMRTMPIVISPECLYRGSKSGLAWIPA